MVRQVKNNREKERQRWLAKYQELKFVKINTENFVIVLVVHQNVLVWLCLGNTLVAASTLEKDVKANLEKTNDVKAAAAVGTAIAKKAIEKGITTVVFDRGGFIYQGKIQALADAAREAGLEF